jgi:hypothetical protein
MNESNGCLHLYYHVSAVRGANFRLEGNVYCTIVTLFVRDGESGNGLKTMLRQVV